MINLSMAFAGRRSGDVQRPGSCWARDAALRGSLNEEEVEAIGRSRRVLAVVCGSESLAGGDRGRMRAGSTDAGGRSGTGDLINCRHLQQR